MNKALEPLAKNKKGDAAKGSSGGDEESVKKAKKVLEFVTGALDKRSARMPLPDASTTLAHAIDAPSAELRRTVRHSWLLHHFDLAKDATFLCKSGCILSNRGNFSELPNGLLQWGFVCCAGCDAAGKERRC